MKNAVDLLPLARYARLSVVAVVVALSGCLSGGGGDAQTNTNPASNASPDTTSPLVSATNPANQSATFAVNSSLSVTFSEAVDPQTVTDASFKVDGPAGQVAGVIALQSNTATFTPTSNLPYSTNYTARVTTAIKDVAGNALVSDYAWTFSTNAAPDITPPLVSATFPENGSTNVAANGVITVTFSESMASSSLTGGSFIVSASGIPIAGTIGYSGTTATFTPTSALSYSTVYTAKVTTDAQDAAGNALASIYAWAFTTGVAPDLIPPSVSSVTPADNATNVAINTSITAAFSEPMTSATISTATFTLKNQNTSVSGTVTYVGTSATFAPLAPLTYNTTYTAIITTSAKDSAGNSMAGDWSWTFTTGPVPDTTPPTVSATIPTDGTSSVAINAAISATFSEPLNPSSITTATFTLASNSGSVLGTVAYVGTSATFTPLAPLTYNTTYTAIITTSAKDSAGNSMAGDWSWTFTTGPEPDTTPPTVSATMPTDGASSVAINAAISATFSEPLNPSSITTATFTLASNSGSILGTVSYAGTTATFSPSSALAFGTTYTATITTGVKDLVGNSIATNFSWGFTTETGTEVGGVVNSDMTWTLAKSPYRATTDVQIAYGATLTIEPGVTVYGIPGSLRVWGTLSAIGTTTSKIRFSGVMVFPQGSSTQPTTVRIDYSEITGGTPYGNANGYGVLNLTNSIIRDTWDYIHMLRRTSDSFIERNIFIQAGAIYVGTDGFKQAYIRNNVFYKSGGIQNVGYLESSTPIVQLNSFLSTDRIAIRYPIVDWYLGTIVATENYWGTTDRTVIDSMIFDRNDDLRSPSYLIYEPFLSAPDVNTPDPSLYIP